MPFQNTRQNLSISTQVTKEKKIGKLFKTLYQRYIRINNSCQLKKNEKIVSYMRNKKRAQGASYLLDHGGYLLIYGSCQCYVCYFPQPRKPCGVQRLIEDWLLDWSRNFSHILQSIPIFPTPNLVCSQIPPPSFAFRSSRKTLHVSQLV